MRTKLIKHAINFAVMLVSVFVALALCEGYLRVHAYRHYAVNADFPVYARDVPYAENYTESPGNVYGVNPANRSYNSSIYDEKGVLQQQNHVAINNYGWMSKHDYQIRKDPDEFRIAVIGDSYTGTATNAKYWSDTLQDQLNQDQLLLKVLGKKHISVLNFGAAGAGFGFFNFSLGCAAARYSPDFVIVNFITEDILRRHANAPCQEAAAMPVGQEAPPEIRRSLAFVLDYGDIHVPANIAGTVLPMWWIDNARVLTPDEINTVKRSVARRECWKATLFADHLFLTDLIKKVAPVISSGDDIERSVSALEQMHTFLPHMLLVQIPTYPHLILNYMKPLLVAFETSASAAGFHAEAAERWMPIQRDPAEIKHWYNLPHDGHWSDKGADLYAVAMHKLIVNALVGPQHFACDAAFAQFEKGKSAQERQDNTEALSAFSAAEAVLPDDAAAKSRAASTYAECGFIADLYQRQAEALLATGKKEEAAVWARKLQALQSDSAVTDILMARTGMTGEDSKKYIARIRQRAEAVPEKEARAHTLLDAAQIATSNGLNADASDIYHEVLRLMPNYLPALEGLAGVLLDQGKPQEALGWLNAAIVQAPDKPEIILARTRAQKALGMAVQ